MTTEVSRRGVLAGLGGIVAGSALAGCGGGSTPAATDPGKVVVMNWEALDGSPYAGVFKDFQTETGKTIEYQFSASGSDYWPKTRTVLGSNNPPDLMRIDDDFVAYYASTGKLLDLREFIADSGLNEADYFPTVFNNTKQPDGSIVGSGASGIHRGVIFYNKTMFAEAGVPAAADHLDRRRLDLRRLHRRGAQALRRRQAMGREHHRRLRLRDDLFRSTTAGRAARPRTAPASRSLIRRTRKRCNGSPT